MREASGVAGEGGYIDGSGVKAIKVISRHPELITVMVKARVFDSYGATFLRTHKEVGLSLKDMSFFTSIYYNLLEHKDILPMFIGLTADFDRAIEDALKEGT